MQSTAVQIRRALVRRHHPHARTFWAAVARAVADRPDALAALVELAATGPSSIEAWLTAAGAPSTARAPIEDALRCLTLPGQPTAPRQRLRAVVRGTDHVTVFTTRRVANQPEVHPEPTAAVQ